MYDNATDANKPRPGFGHWTARARDGEVVYEHSSGIETTDSEFVEATTHQRGPAPADPGGARC